MRCYIFIPTVLFLFISGSLLIGNSPNNAFIQGPSIFKYCSGTCPDVNLDAMPSLDHPLADYEGHKIYSHYRRLLLASPNAPLDAVETLTCCLPYDFEMIPFMFRDAAGAIRFGNIAIPLSCMCV